MDMHNKRNEIFGGGVEECKDKIIDMVKEIDDLWILQLLLKTIIHITKEGN